MLITISLIERKVISVSEVRRRKGESFEAMVRRFSRKVVQSGKIIEVKKGKFRRRTKNRAATRKSALRRRELASSREYLEKIGKLKDERRRGRSRK